MEKYISLIIILLLASCGSSYRDADIKMDAADVVMNSNPDSALHIISQIDTCGLPAERLARYALLMTKAKDKCYISLVNDSLIKVAVKETEGRNDSVEMQALYYYGVTLWEQNKRSEAIVNLHMAYDKAKSLNDSFYVALSARELANAYMKCYIYDKALDFALEAKENFRNSNHIKHSAFMDEMISKLFIYKDEHYKAIEVCNGVDTLLYKENTGFRHLILKNEAEALDYLGKYNRAIDKYDSLKGDGYRMRCLDWCNVSDIYYKSGNINNLRIALDSARLLISSKRDSIYIYKLDAQLCLANSDYKGAAELGLKFGEKLMEDVSYKLAFPNTLLITEQYKRLSDSRELETRYLKDRLIWIVSFTGLLVICSIMVILYLRLRLKSSKMKIQNLTLITKELQDAMKAEKLSESESCIGDNEWNKIAKDKLDTINRACTAWFRIQNNKDEISKLPLDVKNVFEKLVARDNIEDLLKMIDQLSEGWLDDFQRSFEDIKPNQLIIARYLYAKFSNETIAILMDKRTTNAVRQEKFRLKESIVERSADYKKYLEALGM